MPNSGDGWKAEDWWPSGARAWDPAPPPTVPAWTDRDLNEPYGPGPVGVDEPLEQEPAVDDPDGEGDDVDEAVVASYVELAMRNLQHHQVWAEPDQQENLLFCFGSADATLYAVEDGVKRLIIGRGVGRDREGCIYCLVGTCSPAMLSMLDSGEVSPAQAFDDAADLKLCSVFRADDTPPRQFRLAALNRPVSNVVLVQRYKTMHDVPVEYHPGEPFLQFTDE